MNKIIENINMIGGILLGGVSFILGGWDLLLKIILILMIFDVITGWLKAIWCKTLSSSVGFRGLARKVVILIIIVVSNLLQKLLNNTIPVRETIIMFYIVNETISIIENASYFIPIPQSLREVLTQLDEQCNEKEK